MGWQFVSNEKSSYNGRTAWRANAGRRNNSGGDSPTKKSGCKATLISKGKYKGSMCVHGWNKSKGAGFVTFFAAPYKRSKKFKSKTGNEWVTYILKVQHQLAAPQVLPCLYNPASGKIICQKLGIVMNPKAANGGYVGKFGK